MRQDFVAFVLRIIAVVLFYYTFKHFFTHFDYRLIPFLICDLFFVYIICKYYKFQSSYKKEGKEEIYKVDVKTDIRDEIDKVKFFEING